MDPLDYNYREFVILWMSRGEEEIEINLNRVPKCQFSILFKLPGESVYKTFFFGGGSLVGIVVLRIY